MDFQQNVSIYSNPKNRLAELNPQTVAKPTSFSGESYYLNFVDLFSRSGVSYCMKTKSEDTDNIIFFCRQVFNKFGRFPEATRSDNEYVSNNLKI